MVHCAVWPQSTAIRHFNQFKSDRILEGESTAIDSFSGVKALTDANGRSIADYLLLHEDHHGQNHRQNEAGSNARRQHDSPLTTAAESRSRPFEIFLRFR